MIASAAALAAAPVRAADVAVPIEQFEPVEVEPRDIVLDLGIGVQLEPEFPAAEQYIIQPWPIVRLKFLRLPLFGEVVTGETSVFSIYPSFDFVGERQEDDASYLEGTDDVDYSLELGPGVAVSYGMFRAFAEARYGFFGSEAFVFDGGVDLVVSQFGRFEGRIGPRVSVATDEYMDAYFGVPDGAVLPEYDPDGGFKDVGLEAVASYAITDDFRIQAKAGYTRFIGDAEDSPIVDAGDDDQFSVGLGFSYRFGLDLY